MPIETRPRIHAAPLWTPDAINKAAVRERDPLQDHCGIIGAFSSDNFLFLPAGVAGLKKLEVRGHDGAGVIAVTIDGDVVYSHKGQGRVKEVFPDDLVEENKKISASMWLIQTRWGTNGDVDMPDDSLQPIFREHKETGEMVSVIHNGEFETLDRNGPVSDTVLYVEEKLVRSEGNDWGERLIASLITDPGDDAYSLIVGTPDGMFLARDPHGRRPLSYGKYWDDQIGNFVWVAASETNALSQMNVSEFVEVLPGEIVHFAKGKAPRTIQFAEPDPKLCLFENVYIEHGNSRGHLPRTVSDEINKSPTGGEIRRRSGEIMAREAPLTSDEVDFVIGVPGTGISGGKGYASALELPYIQAIKDKKPPEDDKRTFMMADINSILGEVLKGFWFDKEAIKGKKIVLVDDSIVRGNVMRALVKFLEEECGVEEVHARVLGPANDNICHYGLNTRDRAKELEAARMLLKIGEDASDEMLFTAIAEDLGLDSLVYLSVNGLKEASTGDPHDERFCTDCMRDPHPTTTPVDFKNLDTKIRTL